MFKIRQLSILCICTLTSVMVADVRLPSIVNDGMVLQRGVELKVWGWAEPGESVGIQFLEQNLHAVADADGRWQLVLEPIDAGGPYEMSIKGQNEIKLRNILIGDVWICSGQSNMTHTFVRWQEEYAQEIQESKNPEIRQFHVPTNAILTGPIEDIPGIEWKDASPENLMDFTVIGYFFAKQLHDRYQIPQGLIMSCVGGTQIEAWTSEQGFKSFPEQLEIIERNKDSAWVEEVNAEAKAFEETLGTPKEADEGITGEIKWYDPDYEPMNWKSILLPGYWEDQGIRDLNGVVWYRRELEIPASMTGQDAKVKLGRIIDADELYVNGKLVGKTTYQYPQRRYTIPAGVLKAGKNVFVVRVTNFGGKGGFVTDKPYCIEVGDSTLDLKGIWQYRVGEVYRPRAPVKAGISAQSQPTSLYNGMIAPYVNYGIKGILWYQGESNAGNPEAYRTLLPNLIGDWRTKWGMGDAVTFLIAQLPRYMDVNYLPEESSWAEMREAQFLAAQTVPNAGIGINIDLGEWNDIHPGNKKPVGERLALQAMKLAYGDTEGVVTSGPIFKSQEIAGSRIILHFESVGSGLVSGNGEALAHFAIAGADKQFDWGKAVVEGDTVVVSHEDIAEPKYVRYAWADNPDFANLENTEGLPAAPFRTDR